MNQIRLIGAIESKDKNGDILAVKRSSGVIDKLLVKFRNECNLPVGSHVEVCGEIHTKNQFVDGKSKLIIYVFARSFKEVGDEVEDFNDAEITGFVCKEPNFRTTKFGKDICDLLIAVNQNRYSNYIPNIAWVTEAQFAKELKIGDEVEIRGRLQSRTYYKNEVENLARELSIKTIQKRDIDFSPLEDLEKVSDENL